MIEWIKDLPPVVVQIIAALAISALLLGFTLFFRNISSYVKIMNNKIDLIMMDQKATDFALNKVLPKNGDTYLGHKNEEIERLMKIHEYVNK